MDDSSKKSTERGRRSHLGQTETLEPPALGDVDNDSSEEQLGQEYLINVDGVVFPYFSSELGREQIARIQGALGTFIEEVDSTYPDLDAQGRLAAVAFFSVAGMQRARSSEQKSKEEIIALRKELDCVNKELDRVNEVIRSFVQGGSAILVNIDAHRERISDSGRNSFAVDDDFDELSTEQIPRAFYSSSEDSVSEEE